MSKLKLPHGAMVLVSDGRKALFLKNAGDEVYPNLQTERVINAPDNPPTRQQGSDRPGRTSTFDQRSSLEETDFHALAEERFATEVADAVNLVCSSSDVKAIVVAAAPRTLASLRSRLSEAVKHKIVAEINKDLTKHPVYDIERHILGTS